MRTVKTRRRGIEAAQAATVIGRGLGNGYQASADGGSEVLIRKGAFSRARVRLREEAGGTAFEVTGQGYLIVMKLLNERVLARKVADVITGADEYRD